jgi:hypothetical protein
MINMSVGWYIGGLLGAGAFCWVLGYVSGRIDGKDRASGR